MGVAASQLEVARGMGVMPVGQGWFKSSDEYGLRLRSGLLFELRIRKQYMSKVSERMMRTPPSTQEMTTTASRAESLQLKPAYPNAHG